MPGPPPKAAAQRRRRNAQSATVMLPREGRKGRAPKPHTAVQWGEQARAYWAAIWSSPMAVTYVKADEFALTRLCSLVDSRDRFERAELEEFAGDAEMRQLEDRYGISPLSRRRLQWEIAQASDGAKAAPLAEVRRLRAVDAKAG